jgi:branched-chain amino acid transport system ATP-binding protein
MMATRSADDTNALVLAGVTKSYRSFVAVRGVDLAIPRGSVTALIGPNGAGKSTLFGMIAGDLAVDRGRILMDGHDVTSRPASARARMGMGRTFQTARVFDRLTALDNAILAVQASRGVTMRWYDRPRGRKDVLGEAQAALRLVGLEHAGTRAASVLTQGERKRLEIALTLTGKPRILLLDEPTAGTGQEDARAFISLIASLHRADPTLTVLLTAHDMDVVFGLAQRVVLMALGAVALEGSPAEVSAADITRQVYLGNARAAGRPSRLGTEGVPTV